jgi:uncharacterized integral membrane protein
MRFRTFFLFLVLTLSVLFALLNWEVFTAPANLSVVFGTVRAPVGLVMLGVVILLGAMCVAYMIYVQGTALMDARRHARELQAQRELVDQAEASRYTELHRFVTAELRRVEDMHADTRALLTARIEEMEQRTRRVLEETGNSLSAHLGELEDRMTHGALPGSATRSH